MVAEGRVQPPLLSRSSRPNCRDCSVVFLAEALVDGGGDTAGDAELVYETPDDETHPVNVKLRGAIVLLYVHPRPGQRALDHGEHVVPISWLDFVGVAELLAHCLHGLVAPDIGSRNGNGRHVASLSSEAPGRIFAATERLVCLTV
jgi:hypothetical protein